MKTLSIVIAAIDDIVRSGLKAIFAEDVRVASIYEAGSCEDLQEYLGNREIDIFLIDQDIIVDVSYVYPPIEKSILIAKTPNLQFLQEASRHKARGYFSLQVPKDLLRQALDTSRPFLLDPTAMQWILPYLDGKVQPQLEDKLLTRREREVDILVREGLSRRAIAERLVISEDTVKSHLKSIARKRREALGKGEEGYNPAN